MNEVSINTGSFGRVCACLCLAMAFLVLAPEPAQADWFRRTRADADARDNENDPPPTTNLGETSATASRSDGGASGAGSAFVVLDVDRDQFSLLAEGSAMGAGVGAFEAGGLGGGTAEFFDAVYLFRDARFNDRSVEYLELNVGFRASGDAGGSGDAGVTLHLGLTRDDNSLFGTYQRQVGALGSFSDEDYETVLYEFPDDDDPFAAGSSLDLLVSLFAGANALGNGAHGHATITTADPGFGAPNPSLLAGTGAAAADDGFIDAPISFRALDANLQPVPGVWIVSDSGTVYPVNGVVVPEPSAAAVATLAAIAFGFVTRRGRRM